jgi:hypothetical protein
MRLPDDRKPMNGARPWTAGPSATALAAALAAAAILTYAGAARAEAPRFIAEVDRNQVAVGEPFVYEVTLSVGNDQISDYRPPDFKGLRVLRTPAAPNQSTQMQFGGAGMFVQISYSWRYELAATQKGTITIGPAHARVGGQDFRSSLVTVSTSASAAPRPMGTPSGAAAAPVPQSSYDPSGAAPSTAGPPGVPPGVPPEASEGGSFIRMVTDKQKVYVGEALSAAWYLYMSEPADKYDTQVEPHTEGFWTEDVTVPSRRGGLLLSQEVVQGRPYQVGMVLKKALFPLEPGRLTITPMEAEIARSDFFGSAVRTQRVRSAPSVIEVLPLPKTSQQTSQPVGFDPANVGTYTLAARVDRDKVAVGEPVTLTIEVAGQGNLRKLALPAIPRLEGWKTYEPRVNVVIDPASGTSGTKIAEVLLLPERSGAVVLPALGLDTFDPASHRYARAETKPMTLTATGDGAAAVPGAPASSATKAGGAFNENVIAGEIRPVHARAPLRRDLGTTFFRTRGFEFLLVLPPLGLVLAVAGFRLRDRLTQDTGSRRRRRARQKVRAHLSAADRHRLRGEAGAFFIEIDRVIREALTSRLGHPVKGLRMDELRALLAARGLPVKEIDRVIALLEECDKARFAPGGIGMNVGSDGGAASLDSSLATTLDLASDLILFIEKAPLSPGTEA